MHLQPASYASAIVSDVFYMHNAGSYMQLLDADKLKRVLLRDNEAPGDTLDNCCRLLAWARYITPAVSTLITPAALCVLKRATAPKQIATSWM